MTAFLQRFKDWFSFDTRSLAFMRFGLGLCIFFDMLIRLTDAEWHYTDIGLLPRSVFMSEVGFPWSFSLHLANGSLGFAVLMILLQAFAALAMAFGWRTRLMTFISAVLQISIQNRNWFINNGGDDIIRALMMMAVFIPWGEIWSIDQWRRGDGQRQPRRVTGTWVAAWFLQVFCIYFLSYVLKSSPIWRSEFTAIYYSSHLSVFATWFGKIIRNYEGLLKVMTFYAVFAEWFGPLLLVAGILAPRKWWGWMRVLVVAIFWGLHLGIIFTMKIGLFPYYCLFMWVAFLPSEFWQVLEVKCPVIERKIRAGLARLAGTPSQVEDRVGSSVPLYCASQATGAFIFLTIFFWNLSTFKPRRVEIPFWMTIGRWTHLYQEWNMFAPFPKQEDTWIEVPAELEDGSTIELITGDKDVLSSKRDIYPDFVVNEHWRKLYLNIGDNPKVARYYGGAWCRLWNRPVSEGGRLPRLRRFSIMVHHNVILPNYELAPQQTREMWKHWCFDEDFQKTKTVPTL